MTISALAIGLTAPSAPAAAQEAPSGAAISTEQSATPAPQPELVPGLPDWCQTRPAFPRGQGPSKVQPLPLLPRQDWEPLPVLPDWELMPVPAHPARGIEMWSTLRERRLGELGPL